MSGAGNEHHDEEGRHDLHGGAGGGGLQDDVCVGVQLDEGVLCRVELYKVYMGKLIKFVTDVWDYKMLEMMV